MPKIPVLLLVPYAPTGMLIPQIMRGLRDYGFTPSVFVCESGFPAYEDDPFADFLAKGRLHDLKGAPTSQTIETLERICNGELGERPKVILQVGAYRLFPAFAKIKAKHPDIIIADLLYNTIGHTINHFLFEGAIDAVVVESEFMADYIRTSTDIADRKICVALSGADLNLFTPKYRRAKKGKLTLGYVARMSEEKNPLGFVTMAEAIGERLPDVKFVMAGGGPQSEAVKARVKASTLRDRITYLGFVESVIDAFRSIDFLCVPSKADGRPVAVMEANGCGTPVLASSVGGLPEMIQDGINGWIINPSQTDKFVATLAPFLTDDEALSALKRTTRAHAENFYGYKRMLENYSRILRDLAGEPEPEQNVIPLRPEKSKLMSKDDGSKIQDQIKSDMSKLELSDIERIPRRKQKAKKRKLVG